MQKVVAILEQHVQWIAIGLGGLFVLLMAYSYFITPPAFVEITPGNKLTAGEVDDYTVTHVGSQLEAKMGSGETIAINPPQHVEKFKSEMAWTDAAPVNLATGWNSQVLDVTIPGAPPIPGVAANPSDPQQVPAPGAGTKVAELPKPPTPTPAESKFGRSVVIIPPAAGQPVAQPVAAIPGQTLGVDRDWVTQMFKIEMKGIDDEFTRTKIPLQFRKTLFLQVEMQRVELDDDGKPIAGTEKILPAIAQWRAQVAPPPFPDEANPRPLAPTFLQWASANVADILQPLYYTIEKGDPWAKPGQQVQLVAFDPSNFKGDLNTLTPEDKAKVLKARQERARLEAEQKKANRPVRQPRGPTAAPGAGPMGEGVSYAPAPQRPPQRPPVAPYRGAPPGALGGGYGGLGIEGGMEGGGYPGGYGGTAPVAAGLPQPGVDYPSAEFDPKDWNTKTIEVWAHDDSIESGKTYRYRMHYKIRNPIFGAGNVAVNDALADAFALVSEWSEWSAPRTIPPMVNFFVATSKSPNSNTVSFDVFRWHEGQQKKQSFPVSPGDQIGGKKEQVDFATGWTVVDFRPDPRTGDTQILLMNDEGKLITRSYNGDQSDQLYRGLKEAVDQAKLAATPVAAGN